MCDKLTAAALEILAAFEKRLESYEAEIARQRKMLDSFFSPEIKLHRTGKLKKTHTRQFSRSCVQQRNCAVVIRLCISVRSSVTLAGGPVQPGVGQSLGVEQRV